jgi:hypothetical protein
MIYASLIGFIIFITLFLGLAFSLSYFWWADRHKTPEVIAAEVMQFSEQVTGFLSILAVGAIAFTVTLIIIMKTAV